MGKGLRDELAALPHAERMKRVVEAGKAARGAVGDELAAMARGGTFERWMAVKSCYGSDDGALVLSMVQDPSQMVRNAARKQVARACDDAQALGALKQLFSTRQHHHLMNALRGRKRHGPVDAFLDWLSVQPGETQFSDVVPYGSPQAIARHLGRALDRAGFTFWDRMIRHAPGPLATLLHAQLSALPGHPDSRLRWVIDRALPSMADRAPDEALALWLLLHDRGYPTQREVEAMLVNRRPAAVFDALLGRKYEPSYPGYARVIAELGLGRLLKALDWKPSVLGSPKDAIAKLPKADREAAALAWARALRQPRQGIELLPYLDRHPDEREKVYQGYSHAARDGDGVIQLSQVELLPLDLSEREARRHLFQVTQLATRPGQRLPYAALLPWDEAKSALRDHMGHPEGDVRGPAVATLLRAAGRSRKNELVREALSMVLARKNEQDPVRLLMLQALLAWPREVWAAEHLEAAGQIVRDGLDAADLSHATAQTFERLVLLLFRFDAAWGARWLATLARERGQVHSTRLGEQLGDDEVRACASVLLELASSWARQERFGFVFDLCQSLGARVTLVEGLAGVLESTMHPGSARSNTGGIMAFFFKHDRPRFERLVPEVVRVWLGNRQNHHQVIGLASHFDVLPDSLVTALEQVIDAADTTGIVESAISTMKQRRYEAYLRLCPELLRRDASFIQVPALLHFAARRRQDLLTPYLRGDRVRGRFATGNSGWVLPLTEGFARWSPEQHQLYQETLGRVCADRERDTPTIGWSIQRLQALCYTQGEKLVGLSSDDRIAIRDMAIRALSRLDGGQGIPALLGCMDDDRARIAVYALRRAVLKMPPATAVALLKGIPMRKVTVAKEVVRLLGEMRTEEAYQGILDLARGKPHRDVKIALLRSLWDHLERDETWEILRDAALGDDWVMASRVGNIPPDRLSDRSERRLSALLARVLDRPEPEARIDLLRQAHTLPIRDHERHFYRACLARMGSRYNDEIDAAVAAVVARATERDVPALADQIGEISMNRKALNQALSTLTSKHFLRSSVARQASREALERMAGDPLLADLRAFVAARVLGPSELAADLEATARKGHFDEFPMAAQAPLRELSLEHLAAFEATFTSHPHHALRLAALQALLLQAKQQGWPPELRARLDGFQRDASPRVAISAQFVFPPLEEPPPRKPAGS